MMSTTKKPGGPTRRVSRPKGSEAGRYRQRERTRKSLVAATAELLKSGTTPTMADVAAAAGVARRTVYLHFPTLEQLLIDAQLGLLSAEAVESAIDAADAGGSVEARVIAMVDAIGSIASKTLPMGRSLIRLTVEHERETAPGSPKRGYRRVAWIERALAPLKADLRPRDFDRLVSALAAVIGWEALIALRDVRGLSNDEALDVTRWTARALVRAAIGSSGAPAPR